MKTTKQFTLAIILVFFVGINSAHAQATSAEKMKKELMDKKEKAERDAQKQKDKMKADGNQVKKDVNTKVDKQKGILDAKNDNADEKPGKVDPLAAERNRIEKEYEKIKEDYYARIEKADPADQDKLKDEMMAALLKKRKEMANVGKDTGGTLDTPTATTSTTPAVIKDKPSTTSVSTDPRVVRGVAKIDKAKAKLEAKKTVINSRRSLVARAETKVADSKARLAIAKAEGSLTAAEIAQKEAAIKRAENLIAKLEESLSKGVNTIDQQKAKLTVDKN